MPKYFPANPFQQLNKDRRKVLTEEKFYGPALKFLENRENNFQTSDMVEELNQDSETRVDEYRAGNILGALRDEYELIDGYFDNGTYTWHPEITSEGSWKDVREELDTLNSTEKPKV